MVDTLLACLCSVLGTICGFRTAHWVSVGTVGVSPERFLVSLKLVLFMVLTLQKCIRNVISLVCEPHSLTS